MGSHWIVRLKKVYGTAAGFVTERRWERDHDRLSRFIHFLRLVFRSFFRNKCPLRATALSYTTLLALIPLLAIGVSVVSSVLQERGQDASKQMIEKFIKTVAPQLELVPDEELEAKVDARDQVIEAINQSIQRFHTKTINVLGLTGFIVVALLLLSTIEATFNDIWGITSGRSWFRRLVQYWTTISLGPLIIVFAFLLAQGQELQPVREFLIGKPLISSLLSAAPFVLISLGFGLFYKLMPNTQVHWGAAMLGGGVGGCLWLLINLFNAGNLNRVITMSKIYGSLAIIPIFLIGLYLSWLIVLFGAQVAYAFQNRKVYLQERRAEGVSQRGREFVALRVSVYLAQRFQIECKPPTILEISDDLGIPSRLVGRVLQPLVEARLVFEVAGDDATYVPGRALENITCHDILQALRVGKITVNELETQEEPAREVVRDAFQRIQNAEREAASVTLKELVDQLSDRPVELKKACP